MEKIIVHGGTPLSGKIRVSGGKNAVLPVIAASILGQRGASIIEDVPALDDVLTMMAVLQNLNIEAKYTHDSLRVNASNECGTEAPYEYVRKMRASVLVMGPLLAREGKVKVALPGGCAIGSRPINLHLKGFEALGAHIHYGDGYVQAEVDGRLKGAYIPLESPSVGATENIMMAATLAEGTTTIENAAQEPEIIDLADYLNAMGARVHGAGTSEIRIEGVEQLTGTRHRVIPDRIEAGTYMIAAALTRSRLFVEGANSKHLFPLTSKLIKMGVELKEDASGIHVNAKDNTLRPVDITTMPHPGFPTDLQPQMMVLLQSVPGSSTITETVFENRFMHVEELERMQANIKVKGRSAIIEGGHLLHGAKVTSTDLRAGAAMILAGLMAQGSTEVHGLSHIDRGYQDIVGKLVAAGANIERVNAAGERVGQKKSALSPLKVTTPASFAT